MGMRMWREEMVGFLADIIFSYFPYFQFKLQVCNIQTKFESIMVLRVFCFLFKLKSCS